MKLRPATLTDVSVIATTESLSRPDGWAPDAIHQSLDNVHSFCVIAERGGEPIGHILGRQVADEAEIFTIAVRPTHRRMGFASALLRRCYADWSDAGVASAYLEVRRSNHAARALYEHAGWREVGRRPKYYRDGEAAVLMRWSTP